MTIMARAWQIARKSAKRWGGSPREYIQGGAVQQAQNEAKGAEKIEDTWRKQDTIEETVKKKRPVTTTEWKEIDPQTLPVILYGEARDAGMTGPATHPQYPGEYSFWYMNRGIGRNDMTDDDMDMAEYRKSWVQNAPMVWDYPDPAEVVEMFFWKVKDKFGSENVNFDYGENLIAIKEETTTWETYYVTETRILPRKYYGWKDNED